MKHCIPLLFFLLLLPVPADSDQAWITRTGAGVWLPLHGTERAMSTLSWGMMQDDLPFPSSGLGLSGLVSWDFRIYPEPRLSGGITADFRYGSIFGLFRPGVTFSAGGVYEAGPVGSGFRPLLRIRGEAGFLTGKRGEEELYLGVSAGYSFLPGTGPFSPEGRLTLSFSLTASQSRFEPVPARPAAPKSAVQEPVPVPPPVSRELTEGNSPITLELTAEPLLFTPDGDGTDDTVIITPIYDRSRTIKSWQLVIREPERSRIFYRTGGEGAPPEGIRWDGRGAREERARSAAEYRAEMEITDSSGDTAEAGVIVSTGILVVRERGALRIMVTDIVFPPDSANFSEVEDREMQKHNRFILDEVAGILRKFAGYRVRIEGHANRTILDDPRLAAVEERKELLPLSLKRAESVARELAGRGINPGRIEAVGKGSSEPLYPFSDPENNWKNRRVEFILRSREPDLR
ncbi:MAG: OmpA family protein [Spirochaetia bacterium]